MNKIAINALGHQIAIICGPVISVPNNRNRGVALNNYTKNIKKLFFCNCFRWLREIKALWLSALETLRLWSLEDLNTGMCWIYKGSFSCDRNDLLTIGSSSIGTWQYFQKRMNWSGCFCRRYWCFASSSSGQLSKVLRAGFLKIININSSSSCWPDLSASRPVH